MNEHLSAKARLAAASRPASEGSDAQIGALVANGLWIIRRHYKLSILVFIAFVIPAGLFINSRAPKFQATSRILVERGQEANSVLDQTRSSGQPDDFQTQVNLLKSRPVVAKAILNSKLWESPEFAIPQPASGFTEASIASSGLIEAFLAHLTVVPGAGTHILDVTFTSTDPATAMNSANSLVKVYIEDQSEAQLAKSAEVVDWLNERLAEQKARLDASEQAVQNYAENQRNVSLQDRQNIVTQKLDALNQAATAAKTQRMAKEQLYNQLKAAGDAPESLPIVLTNPVLQQLRTQVADLKQKEAVLAQEFGPRHPLRTNIQSEIDMTEARLKGELSKVVTSIKNDYDLAVTLEQTYIQALEEQKQEVLDLSGKSMEYGALQRQATSDKQLYEILLTQTQTRSIAGKTVERKVRVIEVAELPRYPVGPPRSREILLMLFGGVLLAFSAPIVREAVDHRVKTSSDVEKLLGLTCLAMVPIADAADTAGGASPLFDNDATAFNEAFRRIRTAVTLASNRPGALRVMVTSALPHEGKSLIAANLAIALAEMNQRVLLIDGDLRRPKVHKVLGVRPFPGFADLLTDNATPDDVIRESSFQNLSIMPCGMKHMSTSELLASKDLEAVLEPFTTQYDCIVFDSPPTGPVVDACIIGQWVEFTVFVVHAESTAVATARGAIGQLTSAGVEITGAVLNRVDLKHAGYYAPHYGGQYSDYYSKPGKARAARKVRPSLATPLGLTRARSASKVTDRV